MAMPVIEIAQVYVAMRHQFVLVLTPFYVSSGDFCRVYLALPPLNNVEDFTGYVALETADGLMLGMPFIEPFGHVCLRTRVGSQAADGNNMERTVCGSVSSSVQAMPRYLSRGGWHRTDTA